MRRGQIADVHIQASAGALAVALLGPRELGTGGCAFGPGSIVIHVISYFHVNARNGAVTSCYAREQREWKIEAFGYWTARIFGMSVLSFPCKRISYMGREVPVLMQNENGPCPLLALANVLCLRGAITIHEDVANITFEELTSLIAEYMLERNSLSSDAELRANQQKNITDCMALFPKLNRGLE